MPSRNAPFTVLSLLLLFVCAVVLELTGKLSFSVRFAIEFLALCGFFGTILVARRIDEKCAAPSFQADENDNEASEMAMLHLKTIESLAIAIDAKDQTTHGHVRRTQIYAAELGKLLHVSAPEQKALIAGAMLHDIGKLAVPDFILNKPGKLTEQEFSKMKVHATIGADILKRVEFPFPVEDVVRFHHERWDGRGYPEGLRGDQIPLVARIIAVVDFYDTTRCDRPYRKGMNREKSLAMLRRMAGSAFDPEIVETFIQHLPCLDKLIPYEVLSEQVSEAPVEHGITTPAASILSPTLTVPTSHTAALRSISAVQREVMTLHEMLQAVGASLDLSDTLNFVSSKLGKLLSFDTCAIYLSDGITGFASVRHAHGPSAEFFAGRRIRHGDGITGWVISNLTTMYEAPSDIELAGMRPELVSKIRRVVSSPLVSNGECFGAITLYGGGTLSFSADEAALLDTVAQHAAFAISNALIFEKTRDGALTDTLTQLPNDRAFQLMLEQRLAQCRRSEHEQLSLLYLNLDDFRSVNECYGHSVGDRILAEVADLAKNELRQMDMLTRHPGDLFVAIMPNASLAEARRVADRLRFTVESQRFTVRTGKAVALELSFGVASFPRSGQTADDLVAEAAKDLLENRKRRSSSSGTSVGIGLAT